MRIVLAMMESTARSLLIEPTVHAVTSITSTHTTLGQQRKTVQMWRRSSLLAAAEEFHHDLEHRTAAAGGE